MTTKKLITIDLGAKKAFDGICLYYDLNGCQVIRDLIQKWSQELLESDPDLRNFLERRQVKIAQAGV